MGKLDDLSNERERSWRRWVWELMQNAKDAPIPYGGVSVEIELSESNVSFRHNGDPFTVKDVLGLIQQVSTKPSDSSNKKVTGKFGTGFITTHLLSRKITVNGIIAEPGEVPRTFSLLLDRSAKTSEAMIPVIAAAIERVTQNLDDDQEFPPATDFAVNRSEATKHNEFIYPFSTDTSKRTAIAGIQDLENTLPLTLAFVPELKSVTVRNYIDNRHYSAQCTLVKQEGNHALFEIITAPLPPTETQPNKRYFWVHDHDEVAIATEVEAVDGFDLRSFPVEQPMLFRDFPMVGSDNFHLPFVLNGKSFFPTDDRSTILLNGEEDKPVHNRTLLKTAFSEAVAFADWLIEKGATNLAGIARSELPVYPFEEVYQIWYRDKLQSVYRQQLVSRTLIDTSSGLVNLGTIRFPTLSDQSDVNTTFWPFVAALLGSDKVTEQQDLAPWLAALGPPEQHDTWGIDLVYTPEDLAKLLEERGSTDALELQPVRLTTQRPQALEWLNELYQFLHDHGAWSSITECKCIPNETGTFNTLDSLYVEAPEDPMPDAYLDVYAMLEEDWRESLLNRTISLPEEGRQQRGLKELETAINDYFRLKADVGVRTILDRTDAADCLLQLHRIVPPGSKPDAIYRRLLQCGEELFANTGPLIPEPKAGKFLSEAGNRTLIELINRTIESASTLEGLAEKLGKSLSDTTLWLNAHLTLLAATRDYEPLLKGNAIIPNREGNLMLFEDLYNFGHEMQPLDESALSILAQLQPKETWLPTLVAEGITIKLPETKSFEELGLALVLKVKEIDQYGQHELHRDALLQLVEWVTTHEALTQRYASELVNLANRTFFMLTLNDAVSGKSVMKILRQRDKLTSLAAIVESGADIAQLEELATMFPKGIPTEVMAFADAKREEQANFDCRIKIGKRVEELVQAAVESMGLPYEVRYRGTGAWDYQIVDPATEALFKLEVKSVRFQNTDPVKLAVSQAREATSARDGFALAVVERPEEWNDLTVDHVLQNLMFIQNPGRFVADAYHNYETVASVTNTDNKIDLSMAEADFRVTINYEMVKSEATNFDKLIEACSAFLQTQIPAGEDAT